MNGTSEMRERFLSYSFSAGTYNLTLFRHQSEYLQELYSLTLYLSKGIHDIGNVPVRPGIKMDRPRVNDAFPFGGI